MDLSLTDIQLLYGDRLYIVPDGDSPVRKPVAPVIEKVQETVKETVHTPKQPTTGTLINTEQIAKESAPATQGTLEKKPAVIEWKPKPTSKVLFALHPAEFTNRDLTDLLKKIVASMNIPFSDAGFGIMKGSPSATDWEAMPNRFAVVFDKTANPGTDNPMKHGQNTIFFTGKLAELKGDRAAKKILWEQLKEIMTLIDG